MDAGKLPPAVGFCGAVTVTAAPLAACTVRFVKLKEAAVVTPLVEAVTVNVPAWLLAVKPGAVATPVLDISSTQGIIGNMDNDMASVAVMLKNARNKMGLSLREVESRTGVSNAYVSQLEGGRIKQPSPQILHKLCDLYGCSYSAALQLAGYPIPSTSRRSPAETRLLARLGKTTREEEEALLEYLQFLRSRKR